MRLFLTALAALVLISAGSVLTKGQAPAATPAPAPPLVILDTDIGDDIDDAFALALILRSPELHLLGIETAFGDTELRARLVDRYLAAVGRTDIPVMAGVQGPQTNHFSQAAYARQWPERKHASGVDFLLKQIRAHPGKITLICVGPLTNIGELLKEHPDARTLIKRLVIMGGSVKVGYKPKAPPEPEWNIKLDPAAAQTVFASGVPITLAPLAGSGPGTCTAANGCGWS